MSPMRRTVRVALTGLCVTVALLSLIAYVGLDPSSVRIDIQDANPLHYPILVVHVFTSVTALCTGPFQFWAAVRRRRSLHRTIGRVYLLAGVLPGSVSGLCAAVLSTYGPTAQFGFGLLSVLWFVTAVAGYRAARAASYAEHREWMVRQFSLTLAAVNLRLMVPALLFLYSPQLGTVYGGDEEAFFREVYQVVPWLCWVPNLIVAEWYLRRRPIVRPPPRTSLEETS
ncbi:DUF2306 domain-containing protein [Nocardiopsis terrae]